MSDLFVASYILLWALVAAGVLVTVANTRQVALLTRRFPFADLRDEPGPELGHEMPGVPLSTLAGEELVLGPTLARRTAFVFLEDECKTCKELLPEFTALADEADDSDVWFIVDDSPSEESPLVTLNGRALLGPGLFRDWKITTVPFAVVVTEEGKVEAKGQLLGVGRLREELGLSMQPASEPDLRKGVVA